jgi:hypothetical protein
MGDKQCGGKHISHRLRTPHFPATFVYSRARGGHACAGDAPAWRGVDFRFESTTSQNWRREVGRCYQCQTWSYWENRLGSSLLLTSSKSLTKLLREIPRVSTSSRTTWTGIPVCFILTRSLWG